jgi:hypothetical protein
MRRPVGRMPRRGLSDERSLPCDDAFCLEDEVTDRVGHDRLRRGARVDDYYVGPRAGLKAVRLQAERPRSVLAVVPLRLLPGPRPAGWCFS